ncbi:immunity protein sdpi [Anaeramoeba ignava]|uniref:Immunity protein sdpi n=1 Tax=Anaeramoeba ignava TaxID=1746090 RepID=A0A9Q0LXB8_ANAIG|nr:immunity protein sdpi [Anaeramoeba ignava]
MNSYSLSMLTILGLILVVWIHGGIYSKYLPDECASHYSFDGKPTGYSGKWTLIAVYWVAGTLIGLLFFSLPFCIRVCPESSINMPNKEYWLSPSRKSRTFRVLSSYLFSMGIVIQLFLIILFAVIFAANVRDPHEKPPYAWIFIVDFIVFILFFIFVIVKLLLRFKKPKNAIWLNHNDDPSDRF